MNYECISTLLSAITTYLCTIILGIITSLNILTITAIENKLTQNCLSIFNRMPGTHLLIPANMNNYGGFELSDSLINGKYTQLTLSHFL